MHTTERYLIRNLYGIVSAKSQYYMSHISKIVIVLPLTLSVDETLIQLLLIFIWLKVKWLTSGTATQTFYRYRNHFYCIAFILFFLLSSLLFILLQLIVITQRLISFLLFCEIRWQIKCVSLLLLCAFFISVWQNEFWSLAWASDNCNNTPGNFHKAIFASILLCL